jgi:hypothetical protein
LDFFEVLRESISLHRKCSKQFCRHLF